MSAPVQRRLLVTGSRTWLDLDGVAERVTLLKTELRKALHELCPERPLVPPVLVHGCARGVDLLAEDFWKGWGLPADPHPAKWSECGVDCPADRSCRKVRRGREYCTKAGFRRNAEMVALGADRCIAFIHNGSSGATQCADLAEKAGIPTTRIRYPEGPAR
jgi:hypothetical protein